MRQAPHRKIKRVLVFGVFDLLHPGHRWFLKQARKLGQELHVIVARDHNAYRQKCRRPIQNERQRLAAVARLTGIKRAQLGAPDLKRRYDAITRLKPSLICLGYDQRYLTATLKQDLKRVGLKTRIVRLKAYHPQRYKTSLIRNLKFKNQN